MKKRLFVLFMGLMVWVSSMLADVTFRVNVPEETKQCYVVGDLPELSSWAAGSAVPMSKVEGQSQFEVTVAVDQLSLFMNGWEQENLIQIFDFNGKLVKSQKVEGPQTIISVESLVKGVYVLQVGERVEKFVKE